MEFLASTMHENDKLGTSFMPLKKQKITATTALILNKVWEDRCDAIFNQVLVDLQRIITIVENDLKMELGRISLARDSMIDLKIHSQKPCPKGCLKLNVDAEFKDKSVTLAILA